MNVRDRIVELRRVRASDLLANPKNWRKHPKAQADALRGVLAEVGYADALLARETPEGLQLIDGHLRAEVTPDAMVPVLILDVDEDEADKILLTHDPLSAMAEADKGNLEALLASVAIGDDAVRAMLEGLARQARIIPFSSTGLTDPDAVPPTPAEPTARRGDLWLCGPHRVMCGDSTDPSDVSRLCGHDVAQLMVTDPPYGVDYEGHGNPRWKQGRPPIENDNLSADGQEAFWEASLVSWPLEGDCYVFSPPGPPMIPLGLAVKRAGIEHHQWLVWVKQQLVLGRAHYHYRHEHIFYGWRGRSSWHGTRSEDSVWEADRPHRSDEHPTMKPVLLVEKALANSSLPGDLVVDPFLGSGTTLIAAERLGRRCYGMEIDPGYVDVAVRRWEEFTGQRAQSVSIDGELVETR